MLFFFLMAFLFVLIKIELNLQVERSRPVHIPRHADQVLNLRGIEP